MIEQDNNQSNNQEQRSAEDLPVTDERAEAVKGGIDVGKTIRFRAPKDPQG